jgi:hypothetical protein
MTDSTAASTVTTAAPVGTVGVEVTALRPCLLTAGVDGRPLVDARLDTGGRQPFDAKIELILTVSDPSAIEWTINGLRGRTLGAEGVTTTVRLTPDNYQSFVANP